MITSYIHNYAYYYNIYYITQRDQSEAREGRGAGAPRAIVTMKVTQLTI